MARAEGHRQGRRGQSGHGRGRDPVSARKRRGRGRGRFSGPPGIRHLEPHQAGIPRGFARSPAGAARSAQRTACTMPDPRNGRGDRICAHRAGAASDRPCEGRSRCPDSLPLRRAARPHCRHPRTDRCLRADHSVELATLPDHRQGRAGARRRLHGRAEAERAFSFERPSVRRGDRGSRLPGRGFQPGAG